MIKKILNNFILTGSLTLFISCAAFRSDIAGLYSEQLTFVKKSPVKILFDFYYYTQEMGFDAIPKLNNYPGIRDFDDIFKESIKELSNIAEYETFTNSANDIDFPERRQEKITKIKNSDYIIRLEIYKKNSFTKHFFGYLVTLSFLDLVPVAYSWDYTVNITIMKTDENVVGKYSRSASVSNWNQVFLIVLYPFHPEERKTEEIYLESLTNLFRQIENENILN
jgi:hypothetical protein